MTSYGPVCLPLRYEFVAWPELCLSPSWGIYEFEVRRLT